MRFRGVLHAGATVCVADGRVLPTFVSSGGSTIHIEPASTTQSAPPPKQFRLERGQDQERIIRMTQPALTSIKPIFCSALVLRDGVELVK